MKDFTKRYTAEQITTAKAYINDKFDTRALSGEDYDKLLDQVLQVLNPTGRPLDIGDLPSFLPEPTARLAMEGEYLKGSTTEPLLDVANVRAMPEMQPGNQKDLEDKTVGRLMLAMARGEIRLELDGTPGGKARDMRRIKDYLDTTADIDGALSAIGVPIESLVMLEKAGPLASQLPSDGDELNVEMVISDESIRKRLVGPWDGDGWDEGMRADIRQQRIDLHARMKAGQSARLSGVRTYPGGLGEDKGVSVKVVDDMRGLSQEHPGGPIWFEDPDNMHVSRFVRDEDNILHPNYKGPFHMDRNPDLSRAAKHVIVTPVKDSDE